MTADMVASMRAGPRVAPHWDPSSPPTTVPVPEDAQFAASEAASAAAAAAFARFGFIVVRKMLQAEEIAILKTCIADTVSGWPDSAPDSAFEATEAPFTPLVDFDPSLCAAATAETPAVDQVRRLFRVARHIPAFRALAMDDRLCRPLQLPTVLGDSLAGEEPSSGVASPPGVCLLQSMCLLKPPGSGEKSWHQDQAYFRVQPLHRVAAWWIALDTVDVDNGCMVVAPGSHTAGIVAHAAPTPEAKTAYRSLATPPGELVRVEMDPGDGLLFGGETLHLTPPNLTDRRRWAVQLHYAWTGCEEPVCDRRDPSQTILPRPNTVYPVVERAGTGSAGDAPTAPDPAVWDTEAESKGGFDCVEPQFWYYRAAEMLVRGAAVPGSISEGVPE